MDKFDMSWFTTIPGMLITGGVVLLLIALIIFLCTSKKEKKAKKTEPVKEINQTVTDNNVAATENTNAQVAAAPNMAQQVPVQNVVTPEPTPVMASGVQTVNPEVMTQGFVQPVQPMVQEVVEPVVQPVQPMIQEVVEPIAQPVQPIVQEVVEPIAQPVQPMVQEVVEPIAQPVQPMVQEIVEPIAQPVQPMVQEVVEPIAQPTQSVIYGGASPEAPANFNIDDGPHQIYGGADPLENTQPIPSIVSQPAPAVAEVPTFVNPTVDYNQMPSEAPIAQPVISNDSAQVQDINVI